MKIFALFDDPEEIQKARDALEKEGRGDEVVEVVSPNLDDNQTPVAPVMGQGQGGTGAAVVDQADEPSSQDTGNDGMLGGLDLPPDEREYFERRLSSESAQVLVLETDDENAEATKKMLKEYGAQHVATN